MGQEKIKGPQMKRFKELISELNEMTDLVGKAMKDGDLHHVWQKGDGYEIQNRRTGTRLFHKGNLESLEKKGFSWLNHESFEDHIKWLNDRYKESEKEKKKNPPKSHMLPSAVKKSDIKSKEIGSAPLYRDDKNRLGTSGIHYTGD